MRRIFMLSLTLASSLAVAQVTLVEGPALNDLQSARNMAMGGAFEALGYGGEVIVGNPAALSLYKRYQIEASGAWDVPLGYGFGSVAVADSTNPLAMGISYTFATYGGADRRWGHLTTVALAYAIADFIHIGITTRHQVIVGPQPANSITMNAGLLIRPVQWLTFGFSGHNLIHVYHKDVRRYFVASVAAQILGQLSPAFDLKIDALNDDQPARLSYHGGIEWLIAETFPIRAGYAYDGIANGVPGASHHYVSGGIGWFSSGSGVDLAYRHEIGGTQGQLISLTLKLQL